MLKKREMKVIVANGITIVFWASAFAGIRAALEGYTPGQIAMLRLLTASLVLVIPAWIIKIRLPDLKDLPAIFLNGFLGLSVYHAALNYGEMTVSAGTASLLVATAPIFTALLAVIFFKEHFGWKGWVGSLIAFAGVMLITFGTGGTFSFETGALIILLGAFSESLYFVLQKPYLKKYGPFTFTTYAIWAATVFLFILEPNAVAAIGDAPMHATLSVIYLGIFPTVVAYGTLAYVTEHIGASDATTSLYLIPILAFVIAWFWLGEVPSIVAIVGGIVTLSGVLITNMSEKVNLEEQHVPLEARSVRGK